MKKILAALLALMMVVACVATLASCGKAVPADYEDAKKALEDAEYQVMASDEEEYQKPGVKAYIRAYKAVDPEDEDSDIDSVYIYYCENADMAKQLYKKFNLQLEQAIDTMELEIAEAELILEKYADDLEDEAKTELEEELEEMKEELDSYKNDYVVGKKGTTVWYGTKAAAEVAAAK